MSTNKHETIGVWLVFTTYDNMSDTGTALARIETSEADANREALKIMQTYPQYYDRIRYGSVPVGRELDLVNEMSDRLFCHYDIWVIEVTR